MKKTLSIVGADDDIYADFTRRVLAFMIDCLLISLPCVILFLLAFPWLLHDRVAAWLDTFIGKIGLSIILSIGIGLVLAVYSACFHASPWRATPGKRLMGITVVNHEGQGIGFVHAFIRQFAFTACGPASLLVGLMLVPFTRHRRGHHDILCDTFVLYRRALENPPQPTQPLPSLMLGSVCLVGLAAIGLAIWMAFWIHGTWTDWKIAKKPALLDEHAKLVGLLTGFLREHGRCPTLADFEADEAADKTIAEVRYFRNIRFGKSGGGAGAGRCYFKANMDAPWITKRYNDEYGVSYSIHPAMQDITCDEYFSNKSWLCEVSVPDTAPKADADG